MAESVSRKVREIVDKTPFLRDILRKGFLNYSNFAESILDEVSRDCSKDVKESAIIMALRRYGADLQSDTGEVAVENLKYTIVMHTNILCVPKRTSRFPSMSEASTLFCSFGGTILLRRPTFSGKSWSLERKLL